LAATSGVVAIAGLRKLVQHALVDPEERVVCLLTESGFKDMQFFAKAELALPIKPDVDQALARLQEP
jgi:threonine synthase